MMVAQQYHQHQAIARAVEPLVQNPLNYEQINQRMAQDARETNELMKRQLEALLQSTRSLLQQLGGSAPNQQPPLPRDPPPQPPPPPQNLPEGNVEEVHLIVQM